jgi:hypothetical protein
MWLPPVILRGWCESWEIRITGGSHIHRHAPNRGEIVQFLSDGRRVGRRR